MANVNKLSDEIQRHAARAFFASAWADQCDESSSAGMMSGAEILDIMPEDIDPAAIQAARALIVAMERANDMPIGGIYHTVKGMDHKGDRPLSAEMFGHYAAMQAMGHGVGLSDAFGRAVYEAIRVPHIEFSAHDLQRDYFKPAESSKLNAG